MALSKKHIHPFKPVKSSYGHDGRDSEEPYSKIVLDNGLTLICQQIPHMKSLSIGVWVLTGSRFETAETMGLCHFLEHAVFKGTTRRNALQIAKSIEAVGGSQNAFTSKEHTCYYATILNNDLHLAVDVLSDLVINPLLRPADIEKEKQVILQEISDAEDNPEEFVQDYIYGMFFPGNPLGYNILGTKQTVQGLRLKQIRAFHKKYYVPKNIIVSVAGHFNEKDLIQTVRQKFRFRYPGSGCCYWPDGFEKVRKRAVPGHKKTFKRSLIQSHLCIGVPVRIPYSDPRKIDLLALNTILGGGMSSRLFQKIRERYGLVYSIYSFVDFFLETGVFGVYLATEKKKLEKSTDLVLNELYNLQQKPIRKNELEMAKSQLRANLLMGLESTSTRMIRLAKNEIYYKKILNTSEIIHYIDSITVDDAMHVSDMITSRIDDMQVSVIY